ncbi:MAG: methylmalonyl-CoA mutase family protein, partial [Anaerolineaceae bacterium]
IEKQAADYIEKIDAIGGALAAIENGFIQNEIQEAAFQAQRRLENHDDIVVGVNKFQVKEEISLDSLKIDPRVEQNQHEHLAALRASRDPQEVESLLNKLEETANSDANMMPVIIECVENKLTLGEICNRLRKVWGEYVAPNYI